MSVLYLILIAPGFRETSATELQWPVVFSSNEPLPECHCGETPRINADPSTVDIWCPESRQDGPCCGVSYGDGRVATYALCRSPRRLAGKALTEIN